MTTTSERPAGSTLRTLPRRLVNRALSRTLKLPAPTTTYAVNQVKIPMRDGVELVADLYEPTGDVVGTLLARGPYGRAFPFSLVFADLHVARGYRVILQSVRGTFGSGGEFCPMENEAADGADTVEWMRRQPWWEGRFATIGISYLGFTQFALLQDPPPELVTSVIIAGPHDLGLSTWGTGAFSVNDFLGWSNVVVHQEDLGRIRTGLRQMRAQKDVLRAAGVAPLGASGRALLGDGAPWWESWLTPPTGENPFWGPLNVDAALDRVEVPLLLFSGWQDLFLPQTLHQFKHLRQRGVDVALTMGPWTHTQLLMLGLATIAKETQEWLDTHLAGRAVPARSDRVRFHVAHEGWRELPDWPPTTTEQALYLQAGGGLAEFAPAETASASFRYDPSDPTPTIGGRLLSPEGGYRDDTALANRRDVLTFTGEPLRSDLVVHGCPVAELEHTSDNPFVDVFVRVSEVDANGKSRNISDGYRRLTQATDRISLELDAISHRFRAGTRIRVLIAGGCHPRFDRNLGGGEPTSTGSGLAPATHEVHFGTSRIVLPVGS